MLSKLKAHRRALRLTQSELASKMNMTRRSIIRWENGQTKPSLKKLQMLADVMGCSTEDFAGD
ncbi:helix-turn-helix domain-containing protein [Synergistaceae bacterium OttesenSCG-928-I11]|nr:helix-turn-helix domain-containing protein [Synergistaceae bacterium OttesenSCG-928-I11]